MSARSGSIARSDFEFQGPYLGPIVLVFGLPAVCYGLIHACNGRGCIGWSSWHWPGLSEGAVLFSWQATAVYLAWLLLQVQTVFGRFAILHQLGPNLSSLLRSTAGLMLCRLACT